MDDGRCEEHVPGHGEEFSLLYDIAVGYRPGVVVAFSWGDCVGWAVVVRTKAALRPVPGGGPGSMFLEHEVWFRRLSPGHESVLDVLRD